MMTSEQRHILHPCQYSAKQLQHEEMFGHSATLVGVGTKRNTFVSCGAEAGFDLETVFLQPVH
jgi:hypothetical protein